MAPGVLAGLLPRSGQLHDQPLHLQPRRQRVAALQPEVDLDQPVGELGRAGRGRGAGAAARSSPGPSATSAPPPRPSPGRAAAPGRAAGRPPPASAAGTSAGRGSPAGLRPPRTARPRTASASAGFPSPTASRMRNTSAARLRPTSRSTSSAVDRRLRRRPRPPACRVPGRAAPSCGPTSSTSSSGRVGGELLAVPRPSPSRRTTRRACTSAEPCTRSSPRPAGPSRASSSRGRTSRRGPARRSCWGFATYCSRAGRWSVTNGSACSTTTTRHGLRNGSVSRSLRTVEKSSLSPG